MSTCRACETVQRHPPSTPGTGVTDWLRVPDVQMLGTELGSSPSPDLIALP